MQSPITITVHPTLGPVVSGRALYPLITKSKSKRDIFSDWFREKEKRFDLKQGVDFAVGSIFLPESGSNREQMEFILTLETAKLLCRKAQAGRGVATLAHLEAYGKPRAVDQFVQPSRPPVEPGLLGIAAPLSVKMGPAVSEQTGTPSPTPIEKMEQYVSGLAPVSGPIETKAQRLRRELAEAEEAERLEALQKDAPQAPVIDAQRLNELEEIVITYNGKVDALLLFFQQSAHILKGITPAAIEPLSFRTRTVRLVDTYAAKAKVEHQQVWRYLYGQLASRCSFDVYALSLGKKDPNYLDVVEEGGQIENLYTIAKSTLVKQPEPAVASE